MRPDLHIHTNYSDGTLDPKEVVYEAKANGLDTIAIADHDNENAYFEAKDVADRLQIRIIPAVEISTIGYHILGYNINLHHKGLREFLAHGRKIYKDCLEMRLDIFRKIGMPITMEKVLALFPKATYGTMNLAMTLVNDPECMQFIGGKHHALDMYNLYPKVFEFRPDIDERPTAQQAIDIIHAANGCAIIAHPARDGCTLEDIKSGNLKDIDGIEVQPQEYVETIPFLEYALKNNMIVTAGSDYHGSVLDRKMLDANTATIVCGLSAS